MIKFMFKFLELMKFNTSTLFEIKKGELFTDKKKKIFIYES